MNCKFEGKIFSVFNKTVMIDKSRADDLRVLDVCCLGLERLGICDGSIGFT